MNTNTKKFTHAYVDFDSTLYETDRLVEAMWQVYATEGVSRNHFLETLDQAIGGRNGRHFDFRFELQRDLLSERGHDLSHPRILERLQALLETNYAASDAVHFLERLRAQTHVLILLTAGNPSFQHAKLASTRLATHFDDIVIVPGDKESYLWANLPKTARALFINDAMEQNTLIQDLFSHVVVIGRKHPRRFIPEHTKGIPYFSTLTEIITYVEQH